jgi:hypothetical protein
VFHGEHGCGGAGRGPDLGVDVLHVVLGGAGRDDQALVDGAVGEPTGDQPQDLDLPVRQARRPFGPDLGGGLPGRLDYRADTFGVQTA